MICHVGTFKLADPNRAEEAIEAIMRLKDIVPGTMNYVAGKCFFPTPTNADVCLIGVFDTKEHYNEYMNHPIHTDEVAPFLIELCDYEIIERMRSCCFEI